MPKQRIKSKAAESNIKGKLVILDVIEISTPDVVGEGVGETYGFFSPKNCEGKMIGVKWEYFKL